MYIEQHKKYKYMIKILFSPLLTIHVERSYGNSDCKSFDFLKNLLFNAEWITKRNILMKANSIFYPTLPVRILNRPTNSVEKVLGMAFRTYFIFYRWQ